MDAQYVHARIIMVNIATSIVYRQCHADIKLTGNKITGMSLPRAMCQVDNYTQCMHVLDPLSYIVFIAAPFLSVYIYVIDSVTLVLLFSIIGICISFAAN